MLAEGAGIRRGRIALLGLARAVADDMTVVLSRVISPRGFGGIEIAGEKVVMEFIWATSFLGGKG